MALVKTRAGATVGVVLAAAMIGVTAQTPTRAERIQQIIALYESVLADSSESDYRRRIERELTHAQEVLAITPDAPASGPPAAVEEGLTRAERVEQVIALYGSVLADSTESSYRRKVDRELTHAQDTLAATPPDGPPPPPPSTDQWHPPTDHEHGHPIDDWAAGWIASVGDQPFGGTSATPHENVAKHNAYKVVCASFPASGKGRKKSSRVCVIVHAQSNPLGRNAVHHSAQVYQRDPDGGVSAFRGWTSFGAHPVAPDFYPKGSDPGSPTARLLFVTRPYWEATGDACEQWYGAGTGGFLPNVGWTICGLTAFFQDGETGADPVSGWDLTGFDGTHRRLEISLYGFDSAVAPGRYAGFPKDTVFHTTQFGAMVAGPTDPVCGTSIPSPFDGSLVAAQCIPQRVASTLRAVEFPNGNVYEEDFYTGPPLTAVPFQ